MLTKEQIQADMVKYHATNPFCMFLITMGAGKTKGSLDCVTKRHNTIVSTSFAAHTRGLIIVHSVESRDVTWPDEIKQYHPWMISEIEQGFIEIVHKKDLQQFSGRTFDWVIWDECHLMKMEETDFFLKNNLFSLILLTGTEPHDQDMAKYLRTIVKHNVMEISIEDGIEGELINDFRVKVLDIPLTEAEWDDYVNIGLRIHKIRFINNPAVLKTAQGARMHFLYQVESKVETARKLGDIIQDRLIFFCSQKEICDSLSEHVYYSGSKNTALDAFKEGTIDRLATCRQLKTGSNIKNFKNIVAQQVNSKSDDFLQLLGRLFRLAIGETGTIYVLMCRDTQDFVWVTSALRRVNPEKIRWYKTDEVSLSSIVDDVF